MRRELRIPDAKDKKDWANSTIQRRAEFSDRVHELSDNGKVYLLRRSSPKPIKAGQSGILDLVGVIDKPDGNLIDTINQNAE